MSYDTLEHLAEIKKNEEDFKHKLDENKKKIKNLKIDKMDLDFIGHNGVKPFLKVFSILFVLKFVFFGFIFYMLSKNSDALRNFGEFGDSQFFLFLVLTVLFSHWFDFIGKLIMTRTKKRKLILIEKNIVDIQNKMKKNNDVYFNQLIKLNITKYQDDFTEFNSLSDTHKQIIKEYIEFINSDEAKLFNMVKNEKQENLIGMKNY